MSTTAQLPAGGTLSPQQQFFSLQHLLALTSEFLLPLPDGVPTLLALQRSSFAGYRAATPVLYRTLTLHRPDTLHSVLHAFRRAVVESSKAAGSGKSLDGWDVVDKSSVDLRWPFAKPALGEGGPSHDAGGLVREGVRRSAWALGFVEQIVIKDLDFGEIADEEVHDNGDSDFGGNLSDSDAVATVHPLGVHAERLIPHMFPHAPVFRRLHELVLTRELIVRGGSRCHQDSPQWADTVGRLVALTAPRVLTVLLSDIIWGADGSALPWYEHEDFRSWTWKWVSVWQAQSWRIQSIRPGEALELRLFNCTIEDMRGGQISSIALNGPDKLELSMMDLPVVVFDHEDVGGTGDVSQDGKEQSDVDGVPPRATGDCSSEQDNSQPTEDSLTDAAVIMTVMIQQYSQGCSPTMGQRSVSLRNIVHVRAGDRDISWDWQQVVRERLVRMALVLVADVSLKRTSCQNLEHVTFDLDGVYPFRTYESDKGCLICGAKVHGPIIEDSDSEDEDSE
ncbi:hypothetical protein IAT38_006051 [Cryptococcus sp. DSM 104549]